MIMGPMSFFAIAAPLPLNELSTAVMTLLDETAATAEEKVKIIPRPCYVNELDAWSSVIVTEAFWLPELVIALSRRISEEVYGYGQDDQGGFSFCQLLDGELVGAFVYAEGEVQAQLGEFTFDALIQRLSGLNEDQAARLQRVFPENASLLIEPVDEWQGDDKIQFILDLPLMYFSFFAPQEAFEVMDWQVDADEVTEIAVNQTGLTLLSEEEGDGTGS